MHTRGPWVNRGMCYPEENDKYWIDDANGKPLAEVRHYHVGEGEGNAALIAAAPELYEALKDFVQLWDDWGNKSDCLQKPLRRSIEMRVEQARTAIAKAEGK